MADAVVERMAERWHSNRIPAGAIHAVEMLHIGVAYSTKFTNA
jgi:hypothetical protein